jgi:hypothetical protein
VANSEYEDSKELDAMGTKVKQKAELSSKE